MARLLTIHLKCYPYSYDWGIVKCTHDEYNSAGELEPVEYSTTSAAHIVTFTINEGDTLSLSASAKTGYEFFQWNIKASDESDDVKGVVPDLPEGTTEFMITNFLGVNYTEDESKTEFDIIGWFNNPTTTYELSVSGKSYSTMGSTLYVADGYERDNGSSGRFNAQSIATIIGQSISNGYKFFRWDIWDYSIITYSYKSTTPLVMNSKKQAICVCLPYADIGAWSVSSGSTITSGINVEISNSIYKATCKCHWKIRIMTETSRTGYVEYVNPLWETDQYTMPQISPGGIAHVTLPLTYDGGSSEEGHDFSEYFTKYSKSNEIKVRLMLTISDYDQITTESFSPSGALPNLYLLKDDDYKEVTIGPGTYAPIVTPNAMTYTRTFNNKLVSGWSQISSSCNLMNAAGNNFPVVSVNINYTNSYSGYYVDEFEWDKTECEGSCLVGCKDENYLAQSDSDYNLYIDVTATNNVNNSTKVSYTFQDGSEVKNYLPIYGWYKPKYELIEIIRCDATGKVQYNTDDNKYIQIKFYLSYPNLDNTNKLESLNVWIGEYHVTPTYDVERNMYTALFNDKEYDRVQNYEIVIDAQDTITKTFEPETVYTYYQQSGIPIPMSLYQDSYMRVGVGLGTMANTPECINIGLDTKFAPNSNLKSINNDQVVSVDAYSLLARGGENSVAISDEDLKGSYVNNVKVLSLTEYQNILEPDEHTLYIII